MFFGRFCPSKMVIFQKKGLQSVLGSAGIEHERERKDIGFGWFGLRLPPLSSEH